MEAYRADVAFDGERVLAGGALASATGLAARVCGLAGRTGSLRAGLDADLLLVAGDPTKDITALRDVKMVVRRGRPVSTRRRPAAAGGQRTR
jgi:imidazolonepropionase-like amidohydrolase